MFWIINHLIGFKSINKINYEWIERILFRNILKKLFSNALRT